MNIAFSNQKGGVGKTTLALLFSDYLIKKNQRVKIFDLDPQSSLYNSWLTDTEQLKKETPFEVISLEMEQAADILNTQELENSINIIDLPGSLNDISIQSVLEELDLILCPFQYEPKSFESTHTYAKILEHIQIKAPIVFIPNQVKSNVTYKLSNNVAEELQTFGVMSPLIADWVTMQRLDFFNINEKQSLNVKECFEFICYNYIPIL